ncbi:MAG: hypothetical protein JJ879_14790 [Sneathiella sp.]|nr:hypothetical protein [Sneathiella sp.]
MTLLELPEIAENQALAHITSNDADAKLEAALCAAKMDHGASGGDFIMSAEIFQTHWFHQITGAPAADFTVTLPAISRPFMVKNTSGQNALLQISGGVGAAVPDGELHLLYADGADIHRLSDAVSGGGAATFSGALTALDAETPLTAGAVTTLTWQAGAYDTDSFFDGANPSRLTIPSGVNYVTLRAQVRWDSAGDDMRQALIFKNGSTAYPGYPYDIRIQDDADLSILSSPVIPVSSGDYFEVVVKAETTSGNKILQSNSSWFSIQAMG